MRTSMIVANWKMNGTKSSVEEWLHTVAEHISHSTTLREWVFCPPAVYLVPALVSIKTLGVGANLCVGAQNCHVATSGAFTGEIAANMLADIGCRYVLVGHSERRQLFQESNAMVAEKVRAAQRAGLTPILCVGETAAERQADHTQVVVEKQLKSVFDICEDKLNIVIAYEPLWAIGTGLTATPEQAQDVHKYIRAWVAKNTDGATAEVLRVLYGGSVNPGNAVSLLEQRDIDGLLVGGASLKAVDFTAIG